MKNKEEYSKQYLYQRVVRAKLFIDQNFSDDINLKQIAEQACFSKHHFIRLFKKIYGVTPNQYLISVRVEKAKDLFKSKAATKKVCRAVGYESVGSFKSLFKKETTLTPASFRKRQSDLESVRKETPSRFIPHCFIKGGAE